ncbi:triacylglycerol lipase [Capronia epimyces CBS 606.96]|uniref:Triacylglycerol lipase n=1 Tax=Capronia epimyces CBS 606.96 TaxID=1182542 RepID=W9YQI2_9EURO|nr:triacylglycerol lipase [Capronia epimyces CBS 606.96]EXJ84524.1 triacylglycerol lipase [Capronia epimyces CBS 606.96]
MVAEIHHPPYPLHSSVKDRLHPDYVAFYNKYLLTQQPAHLQPLAISRRAGSVVVCHSDPLPVGKTEDLFISRRETPGPQLPIRCFTPPGEPPRSGWPVVLYFHGGGWVFGDLDTENNVCTNMAVRAKSVVITTDYRLAPEEPWPAAIHDSWEAFLWTTAQGQSLLNIDLSKMAVSGASAGANIAAVIAQKAALRPQPGVSMRSQVLVVPITDNTATPYSSPTWKAFEFTAGLPAKKMLWYRHHYLPNQADRSHQEASPLMASDEVFKQLPPAKILVGELDVLRHEGEEYGRKLKANGVPASVTVMEGMPHPFLAMDAVLEAGKKAITIMCDQLVRAFA